jgi:L-alanine-DL-glutamate epimerase-like enolase superfamily enzyme
MAEDTIEEMAVDLLEVPLARTVQTGRFSIPNAYFVLVRLRSCGVEGIGYATVLRPSYGRPLAQLTDSLRPLVTGLPADRPEHVWNVAAQQMYKAGPGGMATWALSALDVAAWDLLGKLADRPLYRLLGGAQSSTPAYAIVGLTHEDDAGLLRDADDLIAQGFRNLKVFVNGIRRPGDTARVIGDRLRTLRDHVGPTVRLGLDGQEVWTPAEAIRLGREVEDLELVWFEEPVSHTDLFGMGQVAEALATPVASGEQLFGVPAFANLLQIAKVDVVEVDVRMAGGVTPFMKIAAMAESFGRSVTNHMMTAIDRHLLAAAGRPALAEYVPWSDQIFTEPIELVDGRIPASEGPGIGCELIPGVVDKYAMH